MKELAEVLKEFVEAYKLRLYFEMVQASEFAFYYNLKDEQKHKLWKDVNTMIMKGGK